MTRNRRALTDPGQTVRRLSTLLIRGHSWETIDEALAGEVDLDSLVALMNRPTPIPQWMADAVLAVPPVGPNDVPEHMRPSRCYVPSFPTIRRLRALIMCGHPLTELSAVVPGRTLRLAGARVPAERVLRANADLVAATYRELAATIPADSTDADRARSTAIARGWFPIGAWDDIDHPEERPEADCSAVLYEAEIRPGQPTLSLQTIMQHDYGFTVDRFREACRHGFAAGILARQIGPGSTRPIIPGPVITSNLPIV